MDQKWETLFEQVFADFPDTRVVLEARKVLEAMGYEVRQDVPSPVMYRWRSSVGPFTAMNGCVWRAS